MFGLTIVFLNYNIIIIVHTKSQGAICSLEHNLIKNPLTDTFALIRLTIKEQLGV